jgi:hypothetical protein
VPATQQHGAGEEDAEKSDLQRLDFGLIQPQGRFFTKHFGKGSARVP